MHWMGNTMIDIAINNETGLHVIHDDPDLVGSVALEARLPGGKLDLILRNGRRLPLRRLADSMQHELQDYPETSIGRIIFMGRRVVRRNDPITLRILRNFQEPPWNSQRS